jgi:hypothetical protein
MQKKRKRKPNCEDCPRLLPAYLTTFPVSTPRLYFPFLPQMNYSCFYLKPIQSLYTKKEITLFFSQRIPPATLPCPPESIIFPIKLFPLAPKHIIIYFFPKKGNSLDLTFPYNHMLLFLPFTAKIFKRHWLTPVPLL